MRRIIYALIIFTFFVSCRSVGGNVSTWADATLVAEQRAIIEQQAKYITELERTIQRGIQSIDEATERLGRIEEGTVSLQDWLRRVDAFVQEIIGIKSELEQVQ